MNTENKYYTPTIEEFHVGFECEHYYKNHPDKNDGWKKMTIPEDSRLVCWADYIKEKRVRVKHLDQEDIEELGWAKEGSFSYEKEKHNLWINNDMISIGVPGDYDHEETHFYGVIKNKSELKKVMQQLGIE